MPAMRLMLAALVATSAIAIVAAVFAIWPVVADAPWEDNDEATSSYTEAETVSLVQAEVGRGIPCGRFRWAAQYQGDGVWYVGAACSALPGTSRLSMIPERNDAAMWSFRESNGLIIPLNSLARNYR